MTPYEERDLILVEASKWQLRAEQAEAALTAARADIAQRDADMRLRENWFNEVTDKMEAQIDDLRRLYTQAVEQADAARAELEKLREEVAGLNEMDKRQQAEAEVARLREALARARGYESAEHFDAMMAAFTDQRPSGQEADRG